jgi:uncharacterized protein (TIGR03437 family)
VRDSQFEFAPTVSGKEAIDVYASDVVVDNIAVTGGGVGVGLDFAGTCDPVASPSNGEVLNSRFVEPAMAGVFVQCSGATRIAGNDFVLTSGYGEGVVASPPFSGAVTGLRSDGNTISGGYIGINYPGVTKSSATNNTISGATGQGIALVESQGSQGGASFPPTGNVISGNLAWGSAVDLYDDGTGQGNTWTGNVCATEQGGMIPACSAVAIVTNPSNQSVVAGTVASFSAAATYAGWLPPGSTSSPPMAAVQWQVSTSAGSTWTNLAGATSSTYSFRPAIADSGKQFRAAFTNNNATATSTAATLTVSASTSAPAVTAPPSNQTVSDGLTATFTAAASGTPTPTVQWQVSRDSGTTWVNLVTGPNSPALGLTCAATDSGSQYRAVFTNSLGTATTNPATLTVLGISAVVSAASFQSGISAGGWIAILGNGLASKTDTWDNAIVGDNLPTSLDGVTVNVGGSPAYVSYISPTQINALAPNLAPGNVSVTVKNSTGAGMTATAAVQAVQPSFFQWGNYVVATRLDYTFAAKNGTIPGLTTVPARRGETIILWGTGFGPTNPSAPVGVEVPSGATYYTANPVTVTMGVGATVLGAALTPGDAGLYQVAVQIPTAIPDGDCPVIATVNGVQSPVGVLITVQD